MRLLLADVNSIDISARTVCPTPRVIEKIRSLRRAQTRDDVRMNGGYGRLDRAAILDAALRIAERPGAAEVRFRDLGEELGADPTAVYRHFRSKRHLVEAVIERLMDDIARGVPEDAPWRTVLHLVADAMLQTFSRYPAIGMHLADARPVGPAELALVERTLRALEEAGLDEEVLVQRYAVLSGFSTSYLAAACRELIATGRPGAAEELPWLPEAAEAAEAHPVFARHVHRIAALDFRSTYETAIALLVDAIAAARPS
jgi:AcrR family transcriptional regulator